MPISVEVVDEGRGFIMKGEGLVTGQEILTGIFERFSTEDKIKKYMYGMSDYTAVEKITMSSDEVKAVANKDKKVSELNPNLVIAIAAPQDVMFGLSRMFEAYAEPTGWTINIFRSLNDAKKSILQNLQKAGNDTTKIKFEACES